MRKILFSFVLILLLPLASLRAQEFGIQASVMDYMTVTLMDSVTLSLLDEDSTLLYTFHSEKHGKWNFYGCKIPSGKYILRFSRKGYRDEYLNRTFRYVKYRKTYEDLGYIYMKRQYKETVLDQVVVRPTQIKMYFRGDTLVYNADAFNLPEGSMLDQLVQMLPGTRIDAQGQIFVNGKKISSLMLNGNDFFRGNPKIALDNLPSYTVKDIKVYERQSDKELALGIQKGGQEYPLVMDVHLKKQYRIGWIGNVEGGVGTDGHYAGRGFLMRFSDQSRVALYADANDVNEDYTYRSDGQWNDNRRDDGLMKTVKGGVDILVNDKYKKFTVEGNAQGAMLDVDREEQLSSTEFLAGGNVYKRQSSASNDKDASLNTAFNVSWTPRTGIYVKVSPFLNYRYFKDASGLLSADFSRTIEESYRGQMLDSVFSPLGLSDRFRAFTISTLANSINGKGHDLSTGFNSEVSFRPRGTNNDIFTLNGSFSYGNSDSRRTNSYDHWNADAPENRYNYEENPQDRYNYRLGAQYRYVLRGLFGKPGVTHINLGYSYAQSYRSDSRPFYNLENSDFEDMGIDRLHESAGSLSPFLDRMDSYHASRWTRQHGPALTLEGASWANTGFDYAIGIPFLFSYDRLDYQRASLDTVPTRREFYVAPYFNFGLSRRDGPKKKGLELKYSYTRSLPDLLQTLGYRDESTPLVVSSGNPDLKASARHNSSLHLFTENSENYGLASLSLYYNLYENLVRQSMVYDKASGIRTYRPQNTSGNWDAGMGFEYFFPTGKANRRISSFTDIRYANNVGFAALSDGLDAARNSVRDLSVAERFELFFYKDNFLPQLRINLNARYTRSESKLFSTMNLFDVNCGLVIRVPLPWNMEMRQDLNVYVHRGYQDRSFNTEEYIWSAHIEKKILKGKMAFRLETFDILNQMGNIQYDSTPQVQTETYRNSLGRYIMLKIRYDFTKQPKKKN